MAQATRPAEHERSVRPVLARNASLTHVACIVGTDQPRYCSLTSLGHFSLRGALSLDHAWGFPPHIKRRRCNLTPKALSLLWKGRRLRADCK
jgi:hypothetical protein